MRKKNAGRWKWLLLKQQPPIWGNDNPYRQEPIYKVVKTGASKYDGAYSYWETIAEYDDPETARAVLDVVRTPSN